MKRTENIDNSALMDCIRRVQGDRSMLAFCKAVGINPSSIYRINANEYVPSPQMLLRMTDSRALPQNGVTAKELLMAAGYDYADYKDHAEVPVYKRFTTAEAEKERTLLTNSVIASMISAGRGVKQELSDEDTLGYLINSHPKTYTVTDADLTTWHLVCMTCKDEDGLQSIDSQITMMFGNLAMKPYESGCKVSLITSSKVCFEQLTMLRNRLSLKMNLSAILIDRGTCSIAAENMICTEE